MAVLTARAATTLAIPLASLTDGATVATVADGAAVLVESERGDENAAGRGDDLSWRHRMPLMQLDAASIHCLTATR